ncbi:hypothetical protein ASG87_11520 [Frateuria sp. Soil773]|uniref:A24 family peptidase n=1 Tax=Frateuria sp. Soil773 TaxID=1736407 RepID=UPI0007008F30|nr:prepilin peptidase [Frateuria sp. Soil773]KRF02104.1 hypothetical protein ASG87_11520 [Frateuria sp. Soil773]
MLIASQIITAALCLLTVISDLYAHRVHNLWLLVALLLGTIWTGWAWWQGLTDQPWIALTGLIIGLAVLLPCYVFGWMGAGDVKFFAVLGFLMGAKALLPIWIVGSLLGGVHALVLLASRHWLAGQPLALLQSSLHTSRLWQNVVAARQGRVGLPYAAYMAMGALLVVFIPDLAHW